MAARSLNSIGTIIFMNVLFWSCTVLSEDYESGSDKEDETETWNVRRLGFRRDDKGAPGAGSNEPGAGLAGPAAGPVDPAGQDDSADNDGTDFTLPDGETYPPGYSRQTRPVPPGAAGNASAKGLTVTTTIRTRRTRTTPFRLSFTEDCDYIAYYCMRAYDTGKLCARTLYHVYHDFVNYCMLDYVNCMERYEVWQVVHMGACFKLEPLKEFKHYPYENDYFLDDYYLVEDIV